MNGKTAVILFIVAYLVLGKGGLSGCQMPEQTGTRTKSGYSDRESFDREMSDLHRQAIRDRVTQRYAAEAAFQQMMTNKAMQLFQEQMNKPGGQQK